MIESEAQYEITLAEALKFVNAIGAWKPLPGEHPAVARARSQAMRSVLYDLLKEMEDWKIREYGGVGPTKGD